MNSPLSSILIILLSFIVSLPVNAKKAPQQNSERIVIALVNNGVISFAADSDIVRNDLQCFITSNQKSPVHFHHIQVTSHDSKYYLVATGRQNGKQFRTTLPLKQNTQYLYVSGTTLTCSTSDCTNEGNGCMPLETSCTPCGNGGKSTKIMINNPEGIFKSIR